MFANVGGMKSCRLRGDYLSTNKNLVSERCAWHTT